MSQPTHTLPRTAAPDSTAVLEELERLEQSEVFRYSERMCRLMRFLVEHCLENPSEHPKEFIIARKVFDKPETFDARIDPIVRVEASRLRAKLKAYYQGEGAANPISILLPKRGYQVMFQRQQTAPETVGRPEAFTPISPSWATSVLVLPFLDLSPSQTEEYFCDAVTEEIINTLARLQGVNVVSRTAAFRLKGTVGDVREIAENLGVNAVLEGSVRRDEDGYRVSVQLLSARDGFHIWADRYEGGADHELRLQDEIANAVADAVKIKMQVPAGPMTDTPPEDADSAAFHLYLKGLHAWHRRTQEGFKQAIALLEQAATLGPETSQTRSRIFAKLAHSHLGLYLTNSVDPREALVAADKAAAQSLAILPNSGEALAVEAFVHAVRDWNWRQSQITFKRALEEAPNNATIHEWYAMVSLLPAGRFVEAETRLRRALDLEPVSAPLHTRRGVLLYLQGRLDEATAELDLAISLEPDFYRARWYLGRVHTLAGRFDRAREVLERARRLQTGPAFRPGILGHSLAISGRTQEARVLLQQMRKEATEHFVSPFCIAETLIGLGDYSAAIDALQEATEQRVFPVICLGIDPIFAPVRNNSTFLSLLDRIGVQLTTSVG